MTDSLRDQLLGLGFKPVPEPEKPVRPPVSKDAVAPRQRRPHPGQARGPRPGQSPGAPQRKPGARSQGGNPQGGQRPADASPRPATSQRSREDIDLAKAYAIRAQREKQERINAEQQKQEEARLRRAAKARFAEFVKDKALNVADADIARHFEYGGKIKRVYVTAEQLKALNAGELGVAQLDGRYLLLPSAVLAEAGAMFPAAVALQVDPAAPVGDDPYADPQYQVPDDLVW